MQFFLLWILINNNSSLLNLLCSLVQARNSFFFASEQKIYNSLSKDLEIGYRLVFFEHNLCLYATVFYKRIGLCLSCNYIES